MKNKKLAKGVKARSKTRKAESMAVSMPTMKKKWSKMGRKIKEGEVAKKSEYMTRNHAAKRLQVSLKDFRRLCILKGIYPRVPPGAKAAELANRTFYHRKDIAFLLHEPVMHKFKEIKAFMKRVFRAAGRGWAGEARKLAEEKPVYHLDHIVRERYPRFQDAVNDLDDALCMVCLFTMLPSEGKIDPEMSAVAERLVREWTAWVIRARALRKAFISVKGYYFEAEINGLPVRWMMPHKYALPLPSDVDFRIMSTFMEFHTVLLKFVFFKLYHDLGLVYPPKLDSAAEESGALATAVRMVRLDDVEEEEEEEEQSAKRARVDGSSAEVNAKQLAPVLARLRAEKEKKSREAMDVDEAGDDADGLEEKEQKDVEEAEERAALETFGMETDEAKAWLEGKRMERFRNLFQGMVVFLGREVPREPFELVILSLGGQVAWDGPASPIKETDRRITHRVWDRPTSPPVEPGREVVQPQWIFDSVNAGVLLPIRRYAPGIQLPPHISPWDDGEYVPAYKKEMMARAKAAEATALGRIEEAIEAQKEAEHYASLVSTNPEEQPLQPLTDLRKEEQQLDEDDDFEEEDFEGEDDEEEEEEEEEEDEEEEEEEDDDDDESEDSETGMSKSDLALAAKAAAKAKREYDRERLENTDLRAQLLTGRKKKKYQFISKTVHGQQRFVKSMEAKAEALREAAKSKAQKKPPAKAGKKRPRPTKK